LAPNMWSLLEKVKILSEPLEELTQNLSSYDACLSAVILAVLRLKLTLESDNRDVSVKTMKSRLIAATDEHFEPFTKQDAATTATALDPQFKLVFFKSDAVCTTVRSTVLDKALILSQQSPCASLRHHSPVQNCGVLFHTEARSTMSNETMESLIEKVIASHSGPRSLQRTFLVRQRLPPDWLW